MEVERLMKRLSQESAVYRWSITILLSFITMKAAFDIFILNLATAPVPFHCSQVEVNNQTESWTSVNSSQIVTSNNSKFSWDNYKCEAARFYRAAPSGELHLLPSNATCSSWSFFPESSSRRNILMEYSLVCSRSYLADRLQTVMQAGIFVSSGLASAADILGRKIPIVAFVAVDILSTIITIFVTNLELQMVLRFFMGFGSPAVLSGISYLTELIHEDYHSVHGNFYWILWVTGYSASGLIGFAVAEWRHQIIIVAVLIGSAYATYPWLLVESPLWLEAKGRQQAVKNNLLTLYRRYGIDTSEVEAMQVGKESEQNATKKSWMQELRELLPQESLCNRKYILVELCFTILFVANAMSYFSASFRRDFITSDPFVNVAISGLIELPATLIGWLLMQHCGRRNSCLLLQLPAGILLLVAPFVPQAAGTQFGARSICSLVSKLLITISFNITLIFGSESLPTTIRATSFVIASMTMRLGQTLTPELTTALTEVSYNLPNFFFGGICFASALLFFLLPETRKRPMPDSIASMQGLELPRCIRKATAGNYEMRNSGNEL